MNRGRAERRILFLQPQAMFQQPAAVLGIQQGEFRCAPGHPRKFPQQAVSQAMKRDRGHATEIFSRISRLSKTSPHGFSGPARESNGENFGGANLLFPDQVEDTLGEDPCLSRSRSSQDQRGSGTMLNGPLLGGIQLTGSRSDLEV